MKILSLFDGISCARLALDSIGIPVTTYLASEIDKFAIIVNKHNYPDTVQIGDIKGLDVYSLSEIDLLIGGSNCQSFSISGHQKGFLDERGQLLLHYVRILNQLRLKNPDQKFLLENVVMKPRYKEMIDKLLGVKGVEINSKHFSAQERRRNYWTNIEIAPYEHLQGQTIKDIFTEPHEFKWLSDYPEKLQKRILRNVREDHEKACTICTGSRSIGANGATILRAGDAIAMLNVTEMEKLQGLPTGYTAVPEVSKTQRIKMIGNGFNVPTIAHILKGLIKPVNVLQPYSLD